MGKSTILIVEDDAILALDLQRMIAQQGHMAVGPFSSGEEAIAYSIDNTVDLILMDIELAGEMNGITTAETLNRTSDIPIVFLTGFSQDPLLERAKLAAPYGYLIKPVPERELAATLEVALHRRVLDQKLKKSQLALAESEARYRHLFENSPLGIFRTTLDGKVLAINSEMARIIGYSTPDEALRYLTDLSDQLYVDQDQRQDFITLLKENGFINNFEFCGKKKNGKTFRISMDAKLTATDELSGQTDKFVIDGFAMDITERKKTAEALRESAAQLQSVFRAAPVGIGVVVNRVLTQANDRLCEMTGYVHDELVNKSSRILYPDESGYEFVGKEKYRQISLKGTGTVETQWCRKDGTVIDVLLSSTPFDTTDLSKGVTFTALDITERKKTVFERERLVQAIEQCGETIVITDLEGVIQYANPAFEEITGHSSKEVVGQKTNLLKSGYHDDAFYRDLWGTIAGGNTWKGQIINVKKDGTLYTEDATISPVIGTGGSIVNYIAVKDDITEKLQSDKEKARLEAQYIQAQKMEAIGRLAGGVAHDFNNMLSVIIGSSEIAREKNESSEPVAGELATILQAAKKSTEIVRQLLAFASQQTISPKVINLNDNVEGVLKMLRRLIGEDIDLIWIPMERLWPVEVDPSQIDQILANLCVNARDAIIDVGKVTIETGMVTFDEEYCATHVGCIPGEFVSLMVSDSGCGIEKNSIELIFEPFFTSKAVGQGTGLGLATVHGIVKQNNGFINVYSEPGEGTTFKVYLPRSAENREDDLYTTKIPLIPQGDGESVLLVEDEPALLQLAQEMLQRLGYRVLPAANPMEALKLLQGGELAIDLLITDVVMPGMNGRELAKILTASYPALRVLFMSGYTADVILHRGVLGNDIHFLQKPFTRKDLATTVRAAIKDGKCTLPAPF